MPATAGPAATTTETPTMRLALGTAQFGLAYGVTRTTADLMAEKEARAIVDTALDAGIKIIDTASRYGTAEEVVGRLLGADASVRIITKTPAFPNPPTPGHLRDGLARSLDRLRRDSVDTLMFHNGEGLWGENGAALWDAALALRAEGLVRHVGASLYTGSDIDRLLSIGRPDVVQIPFNALDDRLVRSGHLQRLYALGTKIHARSVFLQGLLIASPGFAPALRGAESAIRAFQTKAAERGVSPLAACLGAAFAHPELNAIVIGVNSAAELRQILEICASDAMAWAPMGPADLPWFQNELLHPPAWPNPETP